MSLTNAYDDVVEWRHHIHRNPELSFDVPETARYIEEKLREFGCEEVVTGIGRTGVVGIINGKGEGTRTIGLRSEMDALPILEQSGKPWTSRFDGRMHACGHDGHAAMLLGAARALARDRNFSGRVAVIFQPAEENGGGGREMVKEGLMERFAIDAVYGMHNMPGLPVGQFLTKAGPLLAETAEFDVTITGKGGHAATPHQTVDPIAIAAQIVTAAQTITSRAVDPLDSVVVSITDLHGGSGAHNVIPGQVTMRGTIRTLRKEDTKNAMKRLRDICEGCAAMHGASAAVDIREGYPLTSNHEAQTDIICRAAERAAGSAQHVSRNALPKMGAEDFSFMLEARPGAMIMIGNGDTAGLHHPAYDFDDAAIPYGIDLWLNVVQIELPAK